MEILIHSKLIDWSFVRFDKKERRGPRKLIYSVFMRL